MDQPMMPCATTPRGLDLTHAHTGEGERERERWMGYTDTYIHTIQHKTTQRWVDGCAGVRGWGGVDNGVCVECDCECECVIM